MEHVRGQLTEKRWARLCLRLKVPLLIEGFQKLIFAKFQRFIETREILDSIILVEQSYAAQALTNLTVH